MSNGNDPAYPVHFLGQNRDGDYSLYSEGGLTKREAFAMAALQGILANPAMVNQDTDDGHLYRTACYHADALLAELSKDPK